MKKSLKQLEYYKGEPQQFEETLQIETSLITREPDIVAVSPAHVDGYFLYDGQSVVMNVVCTVDITLPSSRSLEPVLVPMSLPIVERYVPVENLHLFDEEASQDVIIPLTEEWIDVQSAVEDHIILSLPLYVLTDEEQNEDIMPSGTDWEVISEEQFYLQKQRQQEQSVDPRLAALQQFFDQEKAEESNEAH